MTSLFRTRAFMNLFDILNTYTTKIAALQEIRWLGRSQLNTGDYTVFYSETKKNTSI